MSRDPGRGRHRVGIDQVRRQRFFELAQVVNQRIHTPDFGLLHQPDFEVPHRGEVIGLMEGVLPIGLNQDLQRHGPGKHLAQLREVTAQR